MQFGSEWDAVFDPLGRIPDDEWWDLIEGAILIVGGEYDERPAFTSGASVELMINAI